MIGRPVISSAVIIFRISSSARESVRPSRSYRSSRCRSGSRAALSGSLVGASTRCMGVSPSIMRRMKGRRIAATACARSATLTNGKSTSSSSSNRDRAAVICSARGFDGDLRIRERRIGEQPERDPRDGSRESEMSAAILTESRGANHRLQRRDAGSGFHHMSRAASLGWRGNNPVVLECPVPVGPSRQHAVHRTFRSRLRFSRGPVVGFSDADQCSPAWNRNGLSGLCGGSFWFAA